jgi:hypothetical protein
MLRGKKTDGKMLSQASGYQRLQGYIQVLQHG